MITVLNVEYSTPADRRTLVTVASTPDSIRHREQARLSRSAIARVDVLDIHRLASFGDESTWRGATASAFTQACRDAVVYLDRAVDQIHADARWHDRKATEIESTPDPIQIVGATRW